MNEIVLVGGGGHALVVAEAAGGRSLTIAGFYDDREGTALEARLGSRRLGRLEDFIRSAGSLPFIISVGSPELRERLVNSIGPSGARGATVIHPAAHVSETASLGPGVYVGPGAVVHSFAQVGAHAIINSGAVVEHECSIGVGCHVAPGSVLGGAAAAGAYTLVGLGSRVLPRVRIGDRAIVGAGAVVIENVPDSVTVVGVPARRIGAAV